MLCACLFHRWTTGPTASLPAAPTGSTTWSWKQHSSWARAARARRCGCWCYTARCGSAPSPNSSPTSLPGVPRASQGIEPGEQCTLRPDCNSNAGCVLVPATCAPNASTLNWSGRVPQPAVIGACASCGGSFTCICASWRVAHTFYHRLHARAATWCSVFPFQCTEDTLLGGPTFISLVK